MALLHEDTVGGGADISGDPAPVSSRNPAQRAADQSRELHNRPSPTPSSDPKRNLAGRGAPPSKSNTSGAKSDSKGPAVGAEQGQDQSGSAAPPPATNPVLPIDWKQRARENPHAAHYHASHVTDVLSAMLTPSYWENVGKATEGTKGVWEGVQHVTDVFGAALDPGAISMSVKNIWEQNTAQAEVARWAMRAMIAAIPPAQLAQSLDRNITGANEEQATADVLGEGLAATANPLNAVAPEKILPQVALYMAPDILHALNADNPDDAYSALTWTAITGSLISAGHLGAFKGVLSDALGRWPEMEKMLDGIVERRRAAMSAAQDPHSDHRLEWVAKALRNPIFKGGEHLVAEAPEGGKEVIERTPMGGPGQFRERNVTKERTRAALKSVDATDRADLEEKILGGEFSPAKAKALVENWKELGFQYNLNVVTRGDAPLRDPLALLEKAPAEIQGKATRALTAANAYINQMQRGLAVNQETAATANQSLWRSLLGHSRGTTEVDREGAAAMLDLAGHLDGRQLADAIEGNFETYGRLPIEGQLYVDTWRLISNEERLARQRAGIPYAVGDYLQRVTTRPKNATRLAGGGSGAVVSETEKHRVWKPIVQTVDGERRIALTQAYEKVADSNAAIAGARRGAFEHLTDWITPLSKEWEGNDQALAIRAKALTDPEGAVKDAREYTDALYRPFETNAHKILSRGGLGHQIRAIHFAQAVEAWKGIKLKVPNPDGGEALVAPAMHEIGSNPAIDKLMHEAGYTSLGNRQFPNVLVHPELRKLLDRSNHYADHLAGGSVPEALLKTGLDAESVALRLIMYNPAVHGWNVAGRFMAFAAMHAATDPVGLAKTLFGHGDAQAMRLEAINAGVINHGRYANFLPDLYKQLGDALGEQELFQLPLDAEEVAGHSGQVADLAKLGKPQGNFFQRAQNLLWTKVDDFATAAYFMEKHAALAAGQTTEQASLWAARRANSWAGYVAPEDTNPWVHDAARLVMFAPAFWRTWGELFMPYYRNSGVAATRRQAAHMVRQEVALVAATAAVGYITNNLLNIVTSGHESSSNEGQNKMKLEVRREWMIRALQDAHYPGADKIDPATGYGPNGEVLSIDDPLTRFQKDVAGASGLTTGHPDYQWTDTADGLEQFMGNRLSPFVQGAAGVMNVDLYQTIKDHQLRRVDPHETAGHPTPGSVLAGLLYGTPNGSSLVRQVTANTPDTPLDLPMLGQVSPAVARVVRALPPTAEGLLWQAFTGTNGPYTTASRTRGQAPSDDEYAKYQEVRTTYEGQMQSLDAEAAGGSITPAQWLAAYKTNHDSYATQAAAFFNQAPEYTTGAQALTNDWEKTYQKATNPDGTLDPAALAQAQATWRQSHSPADYAAVQSELSQNDRKYKMLGLYHKTVAGYLAWQERWAKTNGFDVNAIRNEASQYGALYGDPRASSQFLAAHRDLQAYETAKKRDFEDSPLGLMYGLFYQSSIVSAYMRARHLNPQQVEQQAEAQP